MKFDDLVVKDVGQLPNDHPAYYLEGVIKRDLLPKKHIHDEEHGDMLESWNMPRDVDYATVLSTRNGHADRMWHIALHLRYWKENNLNTKYVEEFEAKFPLIDLLNIPLPIIG